MDTGQFSLSEHSGTVLYGTYCCRRCSAPFPRPGWYHSTHLPSNSRFTLSNMNMYNFLSRLHYSPEEKCRSSLSATQRWKLYSFRKERILLQEYCCRHFPRTGWYHSPQQQPLSDPIRKHCQRDNGPGLYQTWTFITFSPGFTTQCIHRSRNAVPHCQQQWKLSLPALGPININDNF